MAIFRQSRAFWPTVMTVPALIILVALGVWQLERLGEKEALLADIAAGMAAAPAPLPATVGDPKVWSYRPVIVTGTFENAHEIYLYAPNLDGKPGYHVLTPLVRNDAVPVLIDRGWVPLDRKDPESRAKGQILGAAAIAGIVRVPAGPGPFTPEPEADKRLWFAVDLGAMGAALGMPLAPVIVEADDAANPGGYPVGGQTRIDIPNNHLDYALTWFGLAAALAVIYVVYLRRRR